MDGLFKKAITQSKEVQEEVMFGIFKLKLELMAEYQDLDTKNKALLDLKMKNLTGQKNGGFTEEEWNQIYDFINKQV